MAIFIGFESGNSYVKSVSSIRGSKPDIYLNTLTSVDEEQAFNPFNNERYNDVYEVEHNREKLYYRVGLPLQSLNQESSSMDDPSRYKKIEYKIECLISIYRQISQVTNSRELLYVTTGVPTKHYGNKTVSDSIIKQLRGTHCVNGRNFTISEVAIIGQCESTYYSELLNESGEANPTFAVQASDKNLMYIDIGHGTTDYCQVQRLIVGEKAQIPGFKAVWAKIKKAAEKDEEFKAANPLILGIEGQLQSTGIITFNNIKVNVVQEREKELFKYAKKIIEHLSKELEDRSYNEVIVCGGGCIGLEKYLLEVVNETYSNSSLRNRFRFLNNAQESNAIGYLRFGLNVLSRNSLKSVREDNF